MRGSVQGQPAAILSAILTVWKVGGSSACAEAAPTRKHATTTSAHASRAYLTLTTAAIAESPYANDTPRTARSLRLRVQRERRLKAEKGLTSDPRATARSSGSPRRARTGR